LSLLRIVLVPNRFVTFFNSISGAFTTSSQEE
jgi:hypothetical protein